MSIAAALPVQPSADDVDPRLLPDDERLRRFGVALDELRARTFAKVGEDDVARVKKVRRLSRLMEIVGRVLASNHAAPNLGQWLGLSAWLSLVPVGLVASGLIYWAARRRSRWLLLAIPLTAALLWLAQFLPRTHNPRAEKLYRDVVVGAMPR